MDWENFLIESYLKNFLLLLIIIIISRYYCFEFWKVDWQLDIYMQNLAGDSLRKEWKHVDCKMWPMEKAQQWHWAPTGASLAPSGQGLGMAQAGEPLGPAQVLWVLN